LKRQIEKMQFFMMMNLIFKDYVGKGKIIYGGHFLLTKKKQKN